MWPLAVALENLLDYPEILSHQPFSEQRGVWSSEDAPFSQACLDQIDKQMCLLAPASSGSLLLLLLTAPSASRQEALSSFKKLPYVVITRRKRLKF